MASPSAGGGSGAAAAGAAAGAAASGAAASGAAASGAAASGAAASGAAASGAAASGAAASGAAASGAAASGAAASGAAASGAAASGAAASGAGASGAGASGAAVPGAAASGAGASGAGASGAGGGRCLGGCCLGGRLGGRRFRGGRRGGCRVGRHLLPVHPQDLFLEVLTSLIVERMGDVLESPVLPLLAGHGDEEALRPVDDLDVRHDEAVVEDDRHESLQLLIVYRDDLDVGDLHGVGSSRTSGCVSANSGKPPGSPILIERQRSDDANGHSVLSEHRTRPTRRTSVIEQPEEAGPAP